MSLQDKLKNAKKTTWLTDGIPKWQIKLIMFIAKLKVWVIRRWE